MLVVAHHDRGAEARSVAAQGGFLHHRMLRDQWPELLGIGTARDRPQPAATSTRQDNRNHGNLPRLLRCMRHGSAHRNSLEKTAIYVKRHE
ncbi:hypothetical protein SXCC_03010 [Gluconacetobacter sp. SXCC-1]|nr:hypothetical protein SXCC_03010 [Gluconacetobacter sp. SXCC-1]